MADFITSALALEKGGSGTVSILQFLTSRQGVALWDHAEKQTQGEAEASQTPSERGLLPDSVSDDTGDDQDKRESRPNTSKVVILSVKEKNNEDYSDTFDNIPSTLCN